MMNFPYEDILGVPHPVSRRHPPMTRGNRAAQFAPFAALAGYEELIQKTARPTEARRELAESARVLLDRRLQELSMHLAEQPYVEIEHFVSEATENCGRYVRTAGRLTGIHFNERQLVLADGMVLAVEDIIALTSPSLDDFDFTE